MSRPLVAGCLLLAACSGGTSTLNLSVISSGGDVTVDELVLAITHGTKVATPIKVPIAGKMIPPAKDIALVFDRDISGPVQVQVTAGTLTAVDTVSITPGRTATLELDLTAKVGADGGLVDAVTPPVDMPDMAAADLATPDLLPAPDLLVTVDLLDLLPSGDLVPPSIDLAGADLLVQPFVVTTLAPTNLSNPRAIAAGDVDRDGDLDILVACEGSAQVGVLSNNGNGGFATATLVNVGNTPAGLALGDPDRDGRPDVFVSNQTDLTLQRIIGPTLAPQTPFSSGHTGPMNLALVDFNRDGLEDLLVGYGSNSPLASLHRGMGSGILAAPLDLPITGSGPMTFVVHDVDHDGVLDVIFLAQTSGTLQFLKGKGDLTFIDVVSSHPIPSTPPARMVGGDFNGDGQIDLALTTGANHIVEIILPTGRTLSDYPKDGVEYHLGSTATPESIVTLDADGDGNLDLAVADTTRNQVVMMRGNGDGTFQVLPNVYPVPAVPGGLTVADLNRDGRPDVVVTGFTSNKVTVLFNNARPPTTSVTFAAGSAFTLGTARTALALADVDLDGRIDLAVAGGGGVLVLRNTGGVFTPTFSDAAKAATAIAIADLDRNGSPDLLAIRGGALDHYGGNSTGAFQLLSSTPGVTGLEDLLVADLDRDGDLDVAIADEVGDRVQIFVGNGVGALSAGQPISAPEAHRLALADTNRDGILDVVAGRSSGATFQHLKGLGSAAYTSTAIPTGATMPAVDVATGDFDRNGVPDVLVLLPGSKWISLCPGVGDGTFQTCLSSAFFANAGATSLAVADINRDGFLDAIIAGPAGIEYSLGRAGGNFDPAVVITSAVGSVVRVADVDGDGRPDLVTLDGSNAVVYRNTSN